MIQNIETAIYSPRSGDRYRVVVRYGDEWRPIFWMKVGKDGSLYLGPRYTNITSLQMGAKSVEQGSISIKYSDGQAVLDPAIIERAKLSFHASGIINAAGHRSFRDSFRNLKERQLVCGVVFQHPTMYSTITHIRNKDICLQYAFSDGCPLYGFLYVAPIRKQEIFKQFNTTSDDDLASDLLSQVKQVIQKEIIRQPNATNQVNLMLPYTDLIGVPDLLFQFILAHGATGPWPPKTFIFWPAVSGETP